MSEKSKSEKTAKNKPRRIQLFSKYLLNLALIANSLPQEVLKKTIGDFQIPKTAMSEIDQLKSPVNFFHKLHNSDISIARYGTFLSMHSFTGRTIYRYEINSDVDVIFDPKNSSKTAFFQNTNKYANFVKSVYGTQTLIMTNPAVDFTSSSVIDQRINRLPSNFDSNSSTIMANFLPRNSTKNLREKIFKPQKKYFIVNLAFGSRFVQSQVGKKSAYAYLYEIKDNDEVTRTVHYSFADELTAQFLDYPPDPSIKFDAEDYQSDFSYMPIVDKNIMMITHFRGRTSAMMIFDIVDRFPLSPNALYLEKTVQYQSLVDKQWMSLDGKTGLKLFKQKPGYAPDNYWLYLGVFDTTSFDGSFDSTFPIGRTDIRDFSSDEVQVSPILADLETRNHQVFTGAAKLPNFDWVVLDYHDGSVVSMLSFGQINADVYYYHYMRHLDTFVVIWINHSQRTDRYDFQTFQMNFYKMSDLSYISRSDYSFDFKIVDSRGGVSGISDLKKDRIMKFEGLRPFVVISRFSSKISYNLMVDSPCHASCKSCSLDETMFGCEECRPGYEAVGDGRCVCPDGTYDDGTACQLCNASCKTCFNSGRDSCTTVVCAPPLISVFNDSLSCACPFDYMIPDPGNPGSCINCVDEEHEICPPQVLYYPERLEIVDEDDIHLVTNFDLFKYMKIEELSIIDLSRNFEVVISDSVASINSFSIKLKPSQYNVTYDNHYFTIQIDRSLTAPLDNSLITLRTNKGSIEDPFQSNSMPIFYLRNLEYELRYLKSKDIEYDNTFMATSKTLFGELPVSTLLWVLYGLLILYSIVAGFTNTRVPLYIIIKFFQIVDVVGILSLINVKLGNGPLAKSFEMLGNLNAPDIPFLKDLGVIEASEESHLREYVLSRMNRGDRDFERELKVYDEADEGKLYRRRRVLQGFKPGGSSSYDYFRFKRGMKGKLGFSNDESFLLVGANTVYCFTMVFLFVINRMILKFFKTGWAIALRRWCVISNYFLFETMIFDFQMLALTQILVFPFNLDQPWRIVVSCFGSYLIILVLIYDYFKTYLTIKKVAESGIYSFSGISRKIKGKSKKKSRKRHKKKKKNLGQEDEENEKLIKKEKKPPKKKSRPFKEKIDDINFIKFTYKKLVKSRKRKEKQLEKLLSLENQLRFESNTEDINPLYINKGLGYVTLLKNIRFFVIQLIIAGLQNTPKIQIFLVFTTQLSFIVYLTYILRKTRGEKHVYFKSVWHQRKFYAEELCIFTVVIILIIIGLSEDTDRLGSRFLNITEFVGFGAIFLNVAVELVTIITSFVKFLFDMACCGRTKKEIVSMKKKEIIKDRILRFSFKKKEGEPMDEKDLEFKDFYEKVVKGGFIDGDRSKDIDRRSKRVKRNKIGPSMRERGDKKLKRRTRKVQEGGEERTSNNLRIESRLVKDKPAEENLFVRKERKRNMEEKNPNIRRKKKKNRVKKSIRGKLRR